MEKDELMKPRFKVMADYPGNDYEVGQIIEMDCLSDCLTGKNEWITKLTPHLKTGGSSIRSIKYFEPYPNIFEKLHWSDGRKNSELPEYIWCVYKEIYPEPTLEPEIFKCFKWHNKPNDIYAFVNEELSQVVPMCKAIYPATQQEYNDYLEAQKLISK